MTLDHTAIRASAGSGKTFQLTNRYLSLTAAGAEPSTILASTFTRLAAGQIRDRVLLRLAEAVGDEKKRKDLNEHLTLEQRTLSRGDFLELLGRLARQMHLMQIRTLDSFFAAIVKAFSLELEIPPGAEVVDEDQAVAMRAEAVRLMLDEHEPQQLVDLLRRVTRETADRRVTDIIDAEVKALYELWCDAPSEAWECLPEPEGWLRPPALVKAIQRLEEAECPKLSSWQKAFATDCARARAWQWTDFLGSGISGNVAKGEEKYYGRAIPADLLSAYQPLVNHAQAVVVGRIREQTLATRDLLAAFHAQYEKVKRRRHAITFDDLTNAMVKAQRLGTLDEICFRLDARLAHLLLDEFQDTSITQWRALKPLVREIVSVAPPEKSFFAVGDVKQSIYGWRDAAPEVLDQLPQLLSGPGRAGRAGESFITERTLARSYRSAPQVIEVVNQVFMNLATNPALTDYPEPVQAFSRGFQQHDTAKKDLTGYVELRFCKAVSNEEDEDDDEVRLRAAAELAADLHRRNPNMRIALLTRTNKAVARLLFELGPSRLNVPASGRGGGELTDAAPVNLVLDLLQLADHPDDTIAAFNVATSLASGHLLSAVDLAENPQSTADGHPFDLPDWSDGKQRRRVARRIRQRLLEDGYAASIGEWTHLLAPFCDARELRRLRQLVHLAEQYDAIAAGTTRASDFIRVVEQTPVPATQPSPVQVMTIHQSKGIEFEAVILAELGGRLTGGGTPSVIVERSEGGIGPVKTICPYLSEKLLNLLPQFEPIHTQHCHRVVRESLSVLYVAMTRAIHGLYIIVSPPGRNKDGSPSKRGLKTLGGVVAGALAPGAIESDKVHYRIGNEQWVEEIGNGERTLRDVDEGHCPSPTGDSITLPKKDGATSLLRGSRAAAASSLKGSASLQEHLRLLDPESRERGVAIHAMFEQVEWLQDFTLDDAALARIALARSPRRDEEWAMKQVRTFRRSLQAAPVRAALSRPGGAPHLVVHRELPYVREVDGRIQSGAIDRIVIEKDARGQARRAWITDIKTVAGELTEERLGLYEAQLETYRAAAAEMFRLPPECIATALLPVAV